MWYYVIGLELWKCEKKQILTVLYTWSPTPSPIYLHTTYVFPVSNVHGGVSGHERLTNEAHSENGNGNPTRLADILMQHWENLVSCLQSTRKCSVWLALKSCALDSFLLDPFSAQFPPTTFPLQTSYDIFQPCISKFTPIFIWLNLSKLSYNSPKAWKAANPNKTCSSVCAYSANHLDDLTWFMKEWKKMALARLAS